MKRFTDTDKWTKDKWFCELSPEYKLFWIYLVDHCDNVGVWEVNLKIANMLIGSEYTEQGIIESFDDKLHVFDGGDKWWIPSFIDFQHGALSEESTSKPIMSYIALLKKHTLWEPYAKGTQGVQGKGKGKGKGDTSTVVEYTGEFESVWDIYPKKKSKRDALNAFKRAKKRATIAEIMEAIKSASRSHDWTKEGGKFIPNMATWLNRDGWLDEHDHCRAVDEYDTSAGSYA